MVAVERPPLDEELLTPDVEVEAADEVKPVTSNVALLVCLDVLFDDEDFDENREVSASNAVDAAV